MTLLLKSNVYADPSVSLPTVPVTQNITESGLTHYWDPHTSTVSGGRVTSVIDMTGGQVLIASGVGSAPEVENINADPTKKKVLKLVNSRVDRVVSGPTPPLGNPLLGDFTAGVTLMMVVKLTDLTAAVNHGIFTVFNFQGSLRNSGTTFYFQKFHRATATTKTASWTITAPTSLVVLSFTFDRSTNTLKAYYNNTLLGSNVDVKWEDFLQTSGDPYIFVAGANQNSNGSSLTGNIGITAIWGRPLTDQEITFNVQGAKENQGI